MTKADKLQKKNERKSTVGVILRIVKDTKPIAHWLLLATLITLLSVGLSMLTPELLGRLTDVIFERVEHGEKIDINSFITTALILAAAYLGSSLLSALTAFIMNYSVSRHFTCRIRIRMSEKIEAIPIRVTDSTPNGEIISRMTNDVSHMGGSVHNIFGVLINGAIRLGFITAVILSENILLALSVIIFVPFSMVLSARLAARSEKHFDGSREAGGKMYALCEENLTGFDTVKVFGLEESQNGRYEKIVADYRDKCNDGYRVSGAVQPLVSLVNNIAYIVICLLGGYLAINGQVSAGELVAFIMYTKLFSGPLESIAGGMSMVQSTVAAARRVYDYLDGEGMAEQDKEQALTSVKGEVIFENVSFSYTEDKPLIENLNLTVAPRQKVAIVGPTGGGKTTIVNLLMRFYDVKSGKILVDGSDICNIDRDQVRERFGMVLQDTVLFSGSVYDNIAYGKQGATREEVVAAAEHAHIDGFINSLEKGYDTLINEDSTNISGGQKQLLTIARAYLANRPILILDEATSNVDTRTEMLIQRTMDELMEGRTAFVIAHRLSTIENADVILVVDGGRIVERGTNRELIDKGGLYSKIYYSQYPKG